MKDTKWYKEQARLLKEVAYDLRELHPYGRLENKLNRDIGNLIWSGITYPGELGMFSGFWKNLKPSSTGKDLTGMTITGLDEEGDEYSTPAILFNAEEWQRHWTQDLMKR